MSGFNYYQILVTSTRNYGEAVSVHTTVLEFEHKQTADIAYQKLLESKQEIADATGVKQAYTKLY
ncbi:hypothetical protein HYQ26_gp156 [Salmonella phage Se-G]|uniref:hypothetical protein n=1 Tax=Salmonella phage Se-G TaxID=2698907 RepID=UPI0018AFA7E9|nr:hypothetical protein HYQ26_gp156 [Salmonella phage Se-G]